MKRLELKIDHVTPTKIHVDFYDHPEEDLEKERKRFSLDVQISEDAIKQLHRKGMTRREVIDHYREDINQKGRALLLDEWYAGSGLDEVMQHVEESVNYYFKKAL